MHPFACFESVVKIKIKISQPVTWITTGTRMHHNSRPIVSQVVLRRWMHAVVLHFLVKDGGWEWDSAEAGERRGGRRRPWTLQWLRKWRASLWWWVRVQTCFCSIIENVSCSCARFKDTIRCELSLSIPIQLIPPTFFWTIGDNGLLIACLSLWLDLNWVFSCCGRGFMPFLCCFYREA